MSTNITLVCFYIFFEITMIHRKVVINLKLESFSKLMKVIIHVRYMLSLIKIENNYCKTVAKRGYRSTAQKYGGMVLRLYQ